MSKTIILPSCDDGNRGDQALVWRTRQIAIEAGLADQCLMLTDNIEESSQSQAEGIGLLSPILRHPNSRFTPKSNMKYGGMLFLIWGMISVFDGLRSLLLLNNVTRFLFSSFFSEDEKKTLSEIRSADACIVKGGGFIHTTKNLSDPYKAYFFLYHVMLAQSLGRPVYVMPNSFGPLDGFLYQWIVRRTLSRCALVTCRETVSQDMLQAIGVESELYPDLAFGLESEEPNHSYFQTFKDTYPHRPIVGITARPYRFPGASDPISAYENYVDEMASFAEQLFNEGYLPVFIEHVVSKGEHESDISAIQAITAKLPRGQYEVFQDASLNCRQLKAVYSECDFVVGTRFHSVIFALSEGVPAIAIGYGGNKGRGIMRDLSMPNAVISIENFNAVKAIELFQEMLEDPASKEKINSLYQASRHEHQRIVNFLKR